MLTGRPPFAGRTTADTLVRLSGPLAADLKPVAAAGGEAYLGVLRRALAKDRALRFQTADEFAAEVQAAAASGGAPRESAFERTTALIGTSWRMPRRMIRRRPWSSAPARPARFRPRLPMSGIGRCCSGSNCNSPGSSPDGAGDGGANGATGGQPRRTVHHPCAGSAQSCRSQRVLACRRQRPGRATVGGPRASQTAAPRTIAPRTLAPAAVTLSSPATISPEAAIAAQSVLLTYVGPIARVLVREAAAQAVSNRDFVDRLCAHDE